MSESVDKRVWVGIDCGKTGGLAIVYSTGTAESFHTPATTIRTKKRGRTKAGALKYHSETNYDLMGMLKLLQRARRLRDDHGYRVSIVIEKQQAMPRDGKAQVFATGRGQGLWEMACTANKLSYTLVTPSEWKPGYVPTGSNKQASLDMCKRLYPGMDLPLSKDEARAEATLIADHLMRKECGMAAPKKTAKGAKKKAAKGAKKATKAKK